VGEHSITVHQRKGQLRLDSILSALRLVSPQKLVSRSAKS
jgi:hypothetical protein